MADNSININSLFEKMKALEQEGYFKNPTYHNSFVGNMERMKQIVEYYNVEKYKVVFVGAPGLGKNTSISNWIGLLKSDKSNCKAIDDVPLLVTSMGRTTVAEVHIQQVSEPSNITIEYVSRRKTEDYILDFCKDYYNIVFPEIDVAGREN